MADAQSGPAPQSLKRELIGQRYVSRNTLVAGTGVHRIPLGIFAYALFTPGQGPIVIDRGTTAQVAEDDDFQFFDPKAKARLDRTIQRANHVIVLADEPYHNGGVKTLPSPAASASGKPYAIAPGVVVIPVPDLAPDMYMLYAKLSDGKEYLFAGDVARVPANWQDLKAPARYSMRNKPDTFRYNLFSWLTTIKALHAQAPQLQVITGHQLSNIPFSAGGFSD